jgi:hypothetical protein
VRQTFGLRSASEVARRVSFAPIPNGLRPDRWRLLAANNALSRVIRLTCCGIAFQANAATALCVSRKTCGFKAVMV